MSNGSLAEGAILGICPLGEFYCLTPFEKENKMVKIDWNQETGFTLADAGNLQQPLISIEECLIGGILKGFIQKDGSNNTFFVSIYEMCCREVVRATEPGFDGIIKALNGHDWSAMTKELHDYRNVEVWSASDEISQRWAWNASTYRALDEGRIGTWTWYARTAEELYGEKLYDWELKGQWKDLIEAESQDFNHAFCVGKALDRGYAKEQELQRNNNASLWLKGYKRKAVVGMELFRALAVLGIDVFVNEQRRQLPYSIRVMEGDDLQGLAGDYPTFSDVETALILQRLCGKKLSLKDLDKYQVERVKTKGKDVKFAKNLHSEVAANLDMILVACRLLKLKGLVEGSSLAEALCSASGVELGAVESILNGHKRKYLPHAIWVAKTPLGNNGMMPLFAACINGMTLTKLPEFDLANHYVGDLTGCCQHLDGAGKKVCKNGWENSHNCNYIFKSANNSIIAHMWVWMDSNSNLVVDSIEARSFASKEDIAKLLKVFAEKMAKKGHKVLIRKRKHCVEEKVAEILGLEEVAEAGETLHGKDWGYSDTDPGDKCYIVE